MYFYEGKIVNLLSSSGIAGTFSRGEQNSGGLGTEVPSGV